MIKRLIHIIYIVMLAVAVHAQDTRVQNRPYTDLRPFHFGVMVGTHLQDLEFVGMGPQTITTDNGVVTKVITTDQDQWDPGFTVGVIGETRLSTHFAFRVAPAMYFGTRNIKFMNLTDRTGDADPGAEDYLCLLGIGSDIQRTAFQQSSPLSHGRS